MLHWNTSLSLVYYAHTFLYVWDTWMAFAEMSIIQQWHSVEYFILQSNALKLTFHLPCVETDAILVMIFHTSLTMLTTEIAVCKHNVPNASHLFLDHWFVCAVKCLDIFLR